MTVLPNEMIISQRYETDQWFVFFAEIFGMLLKGQGTLIKSEMNYFSNVKDTEENFASSLNSLILQKGNSTFITEMSMLVYVNVEYLWVI